MNASRLLSVDEDAAGEDATGGAESIDMQGCYPQT
jgi:hypothetical protein